MQNSLVFLLISLGFFIVIILLQIYLSKRESKWLGLVLPVISFFFSIIGVLFVPESVSTTYIIIGSIIVFLLLNIPTIILIAIYFTCRKKIKRNKEIDKMNIQDL